MNNKDFESKKIIIWDWNGTLLDDVDYCVENINILLKKRNLPLIDNNIYREVFTFPVINYYRAIGFDIDNEGFEKPAHEYIDLYFGNFKKTKLYPCTYDVLKTIHNSGYKQVVLSAMEHKSLSQTLEEKGILKFFDVVAGIGDHYGGSKLETGKKLIQELNVPAKDVVMVGDTLHDKEVADTLGVDAVLLTTGHNSKSRLSQTGVVLIDKLSDIITLL
jgi:phosphoglycolate phosphatase